MVNLPGFEAPSFDPLPGSASSASMFIAEVVAPPCRGRVVAPGRGLERRRPSREPVAADAETRG